MPSIWSLPNWLIAPFWPTVVFFGAMWPNYLPFSLIFISAFAALLYAILTAVREDRPELWWVVIPLTIAHVALFVGHLFSGYGFVACLIAELVAVAWLIWSTRENKVLAASATYFSVVYAFLPFVFSNADGSM